MMMALCFICAMNCFPQKAAADCQKNITTLAEIIGYVRPFIQELPNSDTLNGLGTLFCTLENVQNAEDVADAIVQYKENHGPGSDDKSFEMIVNIYVAVKNQDIVGVLEALAQIPMDQLVCIVADIMFPGVGGTTCAIGEELLSLCSGITEGVVDFLNDVVAFFNELAGAGDMVSQSGGCGDPTLTGHQFSPTGEKRTYTFSGTCRLWDNHSNGDESDNFRTYKYTILARYGFGAEATQEITVDYGNGQYSQGVYSWYCKDDPWLKPVPDCNHEPKLVSGYYLPKPYNYMISVLVTNSAFSFQRAAITAEYSKLVRSYVPVFTNPVPGRKYLGEILIGGKVNTNVTGVDLEMNGTPAASPGNTSPLPYMTDTYELKVNGGFTKRFVLKPGKYQARARVSSVSEGSTAIMGWNDWVPFEIISEQFALKAVSGGYPNIDSVTIDGAIGSIPAELYNLYNWEVTLSFEPVKGGGKAFDVTAKLTNGLLNKTYNAMPAGTWKVKAKLSLPSDGAWCEPKEFTILQAPPAPTLSGVSKNGKVNLTVNAWAGCNSSSCSNGSEFIPEIISVDCERKDPDKGDFKYRFGIAVKGGKAEAQDADYGLVAGKTYTYRIKGYDKDHNVTPWSNEVTVAMAGGETPPPLAPEIKSVTQITGTMNVKVLWDPAIYGKVATSGFIVERDQRSKRGWQQVFKSTNGTATKEWTDTIKEEDTYYYQIRGYNDYGQGDPSNPVGIQVINPNPGSSSTGTASQQQPAKADLAPTDSFTIAGRTSRWGLGITLDTKDAERVDNGRCFFTIKFSAQNIGKADTGVFKTSIIDSGSSTTRWDQQWSNLKPGASDFRSAVIDLKPGLTNLYLSLDSANQVQDSNRGNNAVNLPITVTGPCAPAPANTPSSPSVPASHGMKKR